MPRVVRSRSVFNLGLDLMHVDMLVIFDLLHLRTQCLIDQEKQSLSFLSGV